MTNQAPSGEPAPHELTGLVSPPEAVGEVEPVPPSALVAYLPELKRYAAKLARKSAGIDPEDLLHDTIVLALRSLHKTIADSNLISWLLRLMHNSWIDKVRYNSRRVTRPFFVDDQNDPALRFNPSQEHAIRSIELERAIHRLSVPHRDAIMAMRYHGLSRAEIAEQQGITANTVGTRVFRAEQQLRKMLDE